MASVTIPGAPPPPNGELAHVCANGGAGLCLQGVVAVTMGDALESSEPVHNDNMIPSGASGADAQEWSFTPFGEVTHGTGRGRSAIRSSTRRSQSAAFTASGRSLILKVLSGSGRLINVLHSDEEADLQFLNSSGVNGGDPGVHTGNACPAACWGPDAG